MKKYVGIDVKRNSLVSVASPAGEQPTLGKILNRTIGLSTGRIDNKSVVKAPETSDLLVKRKVEFLEIPDNHLTENDKKFDNTACQYEEAVEETVEGNDTPNIANTGKMVSNQVVEDADNQKGLPFALTREGHIDETITLRESGNFEKNSGEDCNEEDGVNELKTDNVDGETLLVETRYNLTERRSSRSTFRGRSSARLPSGSNLLSEYNLGVVALSRKKRKNGVEKQSQMKEKTGIYYLDYGDGKLHDSMEIPKVKDCSRPWCNPHCKTCRKRTFSRPCFVLIPADENVRKRKLPLDKRRLSMFPVYLSSTKSSKDAEEENAENIHPVSKEINKESGEKGAEKTEKNENSEINVDVPEEKDENEENENDINAEAETEVLIQQSVTKRRGYSKKRIEELSQPRGGPPAEVRFSKMSLRKQQEELIEDERRKVLTDFERENLENIQGRITVFLALLNEKEVMGKPGKMVDIPIRMAVDTKNTSMDKKIKTKRHRKVLFNQRSRLLS